MTVKRKGVAQGQRQQQLDRRSVLDNTMANLCNLPYEILLEIAKRLKNLKDFRSFRGVSKSLRAVARADYFEGLPLRQGTPYLLLSVRDGCNKRKDVSDEIREVDSLFKGESIVASVEFPDFKSKKCLESLGWLLVVGLDGTMSLLDPFSGIEIPVPHLNTFPEFDSHETVAHRFIVKMVLSSRPSETSDFILMIIAGSCQQQLAIWRLGDKAWNMIEDQGQRYVDVVCGGGAQFYAISLSGFIWAFNLARNDNHGKCHMILNGESTFLPGFGNQYMWNQYILKTDNDSLLFITRAVDLCTTKRFNVHVVDIVTGTWKEIHSLGSMAVFLGHNSTFALDASRFPGTVIKANRIYFTDDYWCMDSGVYNMETGVIVSIYRPGERFPSTVSRSFWITPCF